MADETQGGQSSSQSTSQQTQTSGSQQGNGSQSSQSGTTTQDSQGQGQTQQTSQQSQAPVRPEYIPETHWDSAANKVKDDKALGTYFNEIIARDAAEQSRRLSLPSKAEEYKVELPADFKAPEGVKYEFKADDPLLAQARTIAHELGIPQEGFSKLLGLYAGSQVATAQQVTSARNAEIAKLGATGPARVDALSTVFKAVLGDAEGAQLMSRMFTARDIEIGEKIVARLTSQGTFKANGREPPTQPGKVTDEQFAKMSNAERLDYVRKFPQPTSNGRAA